MLKAKSLYQGKWRIHGSRGKEKDGGWREGKWEGDQGVGDKAQDGD